MGMIEAPFGDLVLGIMQNPYLRWGLALAVLGWVFVVGDEGARLRKLYLIAPLAAALVIQFADALMPGAGRGSWFDAYLVSIEALRRLASPVGVAAILGALACGYVRLIGGAWLLVVLSSAYFADQMMPQAKSFFSSAVLAQIAALAPSVLIVLISAYGLGATARHLRERYDVD